ncbi:hypothetical protein MUP59_07780 [Candidatus Bathyarchaeota archaeon]|nr:hypothetical protein [Candidatus Bathyarchaeota archaeon]
MSTNYELHTENLKMLDKAISSAQRTLRDHISKDETTDIYVHTKILSLLVSLWAEVRILKLIHEIGAIGPSERGRIIKCRTLKERWKTSLDIAFCKAYGIARESNICCPSTPFTARSRYNVLNDIIGKDLLHSTELRNRVAHGQWKYAFNVGLTDINSILTGQLRKENIIEIQLKWKMFKSLAQIIHDLAVSRKTFERDFDINFRRIEEQRQNLHHRDFEDYRSKMIAKRRRANAARKDSSPWTGTSA